MTEDRQVEILLEQAELRMRFSDWAGAVQLLCRALALVPDHARAHATLAIALVHEERLPGAEVEARLALRLDGNDEHCHYAMAVVLRARRKLDAAWEHCEVALQAQAVSPDVRVLAASIRSLRGEIAEARGLLAEALAEAPTHTAALIELARLELGEGRHGEAARLIEEALRASPESVDAHVLAGTIDLVRGDAAAAEEHARFALHHAAHDRDAMQLWTSVIAYRSPLLGLWWRFNAWVSLRNERRQVTLLIGSFLVMQTAIIVALAADLYVLEQVLRFGWLGFCAYTWVAPSIFRRMLEAELRTVRLDPNF